MPPERRKKKKKKASSDSDVEVVIKRVKKKIKRASELDDPMRICVYGRPGKGKTRLMATLPKVLLIDVNDRGTKSTKKDLDPDVFQVEYWAELNDVYWFLKMGDHEYESVVLDTVTAMQNLALKFVMGDEASRDASRDPDMPSRAIWGKTNELVKTQIINFRNLPMNFGVTAHERARDVGEDEEDTQIVISPELSPGAMKTLEGAVDIIGHMTKKKVRVKKGEKKITVVRYELFVGESERFITKDRFGAFGEVVRNPHLGEMIAKTQEA